MDIFHSCYLERKENRNKQTSKHSVEHSREDTSAGQNKEEEERRKGYQLIGQEEYCFERKSSIASIEKIFQ
jgi:hypothetical protein